MSNQMRCWSCLAAVAVAIPGTGASLAGQAADPPPGPKVFYACYAPLTGVVYRIKESGLPAKCFHSTHVEFSWTDAQGALRSGDAAGGDLLGTFPNPTVAALQRRPVSPDPPTNGQILAFDGTSWGPATPTAGVTAHGALTGLENDDHSQYLRADGARALAGNLSAGGFKLTNVGAANTPGDAVPFEQAVKQGDPAAGDISGTFSNLTVVGLRGRAVSGVVPTAGQVLTFDGGAWRPATPASGGGGSGAWGVVTVAVCNRSPSVASASVVVFEAASSNSCDAGRLRLTNLVGAVQGQVVTALIHGGGRVEILGAGLAVFNFRLNGDFIGGDGDTITLVFVGAVWYEVARIDNP